MQSHFTVLVTGENYSPAVDILRRMGLTTAFVPADRLIPTLRRGSTFDYAADVILIDGATGNPLSGQGTLTALRICQALDALAEMYVMPSGVRWNATPRVVLGKEHDHILLPSGKCGPVEFVAQGAWSADGCYELSRGPAYWQRVYATLQKQHLAFAPVLADCMKSLGVLLKEAHGEVLRDGLRYGVKREDLEAELYDGKHDRFFDHNSRTMKRVLSVLSHSAESTARAIETLAKVAFDRRAREEVPETLTHLHPYFFDIAPHEAAAQRTLRVGGGIIRFDFLRRDTGLAGRPLPELIEFKRPGHRQMQDRYSLAHTEYHAAEQSEFYLGQLQQHDDVAQRRLGMSFRNTRTRVVGGYVRGADLKRLAELRARFPKTAIEGWDEVAERNRRRYGISA
jgi:hypothetical protein